MKRNYATGKKKATSERRKRAGGFNNFAGTNVCGVQEWTVYIESRLRHFQFEGR
jgi:hypothetical protein